MSAVEADLLTPVSDGETPFHIAVAVLAAQRSDRGFEENLSQRAVEALATLCEQWQSRARELSLRRAADDFEQELSARDVREAEAQAVRDCLRGLAYAVVRLLEAV